MADRWFSALLVITVVLGVTWSVLIEPVVIAELLLASMLGLMGVLAITTLNRATSSVMMPLFFIAAVVYNAYVYLIYMAEASSVSAYLMQPAGYLLVATTLLSLVGLILGFISRKTCSPCSPEKMQKKTSAKMLTKNGKMLVGKMAAAKQVKPAKKMAGRKKKAGRKSRKSSKASGNGKE